MPRTHQELDDSSADVQAAPRRNLADLCTDAFMLIFHISGGNDPGHPDQLKKDISLLLQNLDKQAKRAGYADEDIKAARYAVCALIDETILNSRWEFKDQWSDRPLQLEHFGEHMAGERFFDLLDRVRQRLPRKVDLLEVFCIALILGFTGKYKLRGREELHSLVRDLAAEVVKCRGGSGALSPHARIPDEAVEQPKSGIPRWYWITGLVSVGTVIILFLVYKLLLHSDVAAAVTQMG